MGGKTNVATAGLAAASGVAANVADDIANLGKIIDGSPADILNKLLALTGQVVHVVSVVEGLASTIANLSASVDGIREKAVDQAQFISLFDNIVAIRETIEAAKTELKAEVDAVAGDVVASIIPDGSPFGKIVDAADRMEDVLARAFPEASADVAEIGNHLNAIRDKIMGLPGAIVEDVVEGVIGKAIDAVT